MSEKFIRTSKKLIDNLEEILVLNAIVSFIIFGFLISVKIGFLSITVGFLFLACLIVKYKAIIANGRR